MNFIGFVAAARSSHRGRSPSLIYDVFFHAAAAVSFGYLLTLLFLLLKDITFLKYVNLLFSCRF